MSGVMLPSRLMCDVRIGRESEGLCVSMCVCCVSSEKPGRIGETRLGWNVNCCDEDGVRGGLAFMLKSNNALFSSS